MILPEDDLFIDYRTSCTNEEAVAKMLGWMKGCGRKRVINMTEYGIPANELPYLHSLESSLEEQLMEIRNAAQHEFYKALEADAPHDVLVEKENAVIKCGEQIEMAGIYLADIDDELAKRKSPALRIDQEATNKSGIRHITLRSLKEWARAEYGVVIDLSSTPQPVADAQQKQQEAREGKPEGWSSATKAENVYTLLAYLIEDIVSRTPSCKKDGGLNVDATACKIEGMIEKANNGQKVKALSQESIKSHIEESMANRKKKLVGE